MISIKQQYKSSARIDGELSVKSFVDGLVLHGTALNTLEVISRDFKNTSQRCFTLTGPYGTGKSTFALYLSLLLSNESNARQVAEKKLFKAAPENDFIPNFSVKRGWKVVKHVCGLGDPAASLANSVLNSFDKEKLAENLTDTDYLDSIKATIDEQNDVDGVLLLLDEMGKALDYQSRENKDLYFFQHLADVIQNAKIPVLLIGFLHQSFAEYSRSMTANVQREWGKVQGRYRDISFSPSIDESLILIGDTLGKTAELDNALLNEYGTHLDVVADSLTKTATSKKALAAALPIDPVVSLLLGPISKRSFSQNERSLFGFLASNEKLSFNQFIRSTYTEVNKLDLLPLYSTNYFWDYLSQNLDHIISASRDGKIWLEAKDAIYRSTLNGGALHESMTKLIALITLFGYQHHIFATRSFVTSYFSQFGYAKSKVRKATKDLEDWKVIIYRPNHYALTIFQGSDIDVNELVANTIDAIKDGIDWTVEVESSNHVLASAHYHKKGTMRWIQTRLVSERTVESFQSLESVASEGEPFLYFVIPVSRAAREALQIRAIEEQRIVIGENDKIETLKSLAIELIALNKVLRDTKSLAHDHIAKAEINSRILTTERAIEREFDIIFNGASWYFAGKHFENRNLSSLASELADVIYSESPTIINELVNRNKPSGSANAAIKKLVLAMAENYDSELLGLPESTFPAEKGLYFSCIKNFGIHTEGNGEWQFATNPDNKFVSSLFEKTHRDLVLKTNTMLWLSEIENFWAASPYGLAKGIRSIWLMAFVLSHLKDYAFYDKNEATGEVIFITQPDDEFAVKLIQKPQNVAIQAIQIDQEKTAYLNKLAKALDSVIENEFNYSSEVTPLRIAEGLVTFYSKLSNYTVMTKNMTKKGRRFLEVTKKASDPHEYLFKAIPKVLETELDRVDAAQMTDLLSNLKNAHTEMVANFESSIKKYLGQDGISAETCSAVINFTADHKLKSFAQRLREQKENNTRWVSNVISLLSSKSEKNWDDLAINKAQAELPELVEKFKISAHRAEFKDLSAEKIKKDFKMQVSAITESLDGLDKNKKKALLIALLEEFE